MDRPDYRLSAGTARGGASWPRRKSKRAPARRRGSRRAAARRRRRLQRLARTLGTLLIVGGVLTLGWAVLVWQWQDPFTALYTHHEQKRLASALEHRIQTFHPPVPAPGRTGAGHPARKGAATKTAPSAAVVHRELATEAAAYRRTLHAGDPIGWLTIGAIGLKIVVVQGTDEESLKKGPGHYPASDLPGQGQLIYIAGHRTTYLAPFSHINDLKAGDFITLQLPYATFKYVVTHHRIVPATDLAVLRSHGHEVLVLQACHPRFFATHRYLVYAKPAGVIPRRTTSAPPKT